MHRNRGVGVGAIAKQNEIAKSYKKAGTVMEEEKLVHVLEQLEKFEVSLQVLSCILKFYFSFGCNLASLQEFAEKHRSKINSDPEFRKHFHVMCESIGIDPLVSTKGLWADLLGVGDFYYEIGVKIIQITMKSRPLNGGLMLITEILDKMRREIKTSGRSISIDDIKRAVKKLEVLGKGFRLMEVRPGSHKVFVQKKLTL